MKEARNKQKYSHENIYSLNNFQKSFWYIEEQKKQNHSPLIYTSAFRLHGDLNVKQLQMAIKYAAFLDSPNLCSQLTRISKDLYGVILKPEEKKAVFYKKNRAC